MRAENMSFDTLVLDKRYDDVPGVEYYEIETKLGTFRFAQPGEDDRFKGILPNLLDDLAEFRKQAKRDMAAAKKRGDDWGVALYNAKQLAYKVTMNSAYGFTGASRGFLPCVPIAASVTATGRNMIAKTAEMAERLVPGSEVVYGDSVAAYTPIIIRKSDGFVRIVAVEDVEGDWREGSDGKEYCETPGVQTWTDDGWTDLERVIRHRIDKDLVRIVTHTGIVDVTDEHSLLDADKNVVAPKDCRIGDLMLHADLPRASIESDEFSVDEARIMGSRMYSGSAKIVPVGILNGSREVRQSFWDGFYDADGYKAGEKQIEISQKNQITCAHLTFLAYSLGYEHVVLSDRADKPNVFRMRVRTDAQKLRKSPNAIKAVRRVESTRYVYDLTTANHHFAAGIGKMIVHNTDSVMVKFNVGEDMQTQFDAATKAAEEISKTFKAPHELEMEKIYMPYVLYSKKRYAAVKFEHPNDAGKMDVKGIALVRRDNCPLVKDVLGECLDAILFKRDPAAALDLAREHVRRVLDNEHPMEKFVVSKTLRTGYKVEAQPHLYVARKIEARRGFAVPSGSRVPYVFIENKDDPRQKQSEKAEDPEYALARGLVVDRLYYVEHQLRKPLESLFEPVCEKPDEDIFGHEIVRGKLDALTAERNADVKIAKRVTKNKANNQIEITSFFKKL